MNMITENREQRMRYKEGEESKLCRKLWWAQCRRNEKKWRSQSKILIFHTRMNFFARKFSLILLWIFIHLTWSNQNDREDFQVRHFMQNMFAFVGLKRWFPIQEESKNGFSFRNQRFFLKYNLTSGEDIRTI